ncbi:MAG: hypothetical protein FWF73_02525 [Spirochaetes bacterium]|nr:hypothetical protein [Spirochaetota bacterium]
MLKNIIDKLNRSTIKKILTYIFILIFFTIFSSIGSTQSESDNLKNDMAVILKSRQGMETIIAYMSTKPDLFTSHATDRTIVLTPDQSQEVRDLWARFLDYQLMLDITWNRLKSKQPAVLKPKDERAFVAAYAAFLSAYRYALDFIGLVDYDKTLRIVLNEPVSELGLPKGSYANFKFHFLNVSIAAEFASLSAAYKMHIKNNSIPELSGVIRKDEDAIWQAGKDDGILNTLRNAGQITQDKAASLLFPAQKGVAEWMGDTRVLYGKKFLVAADQISLIERRILPGDILLERREWYLSNIGLPGYWPHAGIYVGAESERDKFFDTQEVRDWVISQGIKDGKFESLLKTRYPAAQKSNLQKDENGDALQILEAVSEGVIFSSIKHSANADSVAVLRPNLSRLEIAMAILKGFEYYGRPYDFDFDFRTDNSIVCTELVYKSFGADTNRKGLNLPLTTVIGRPVLTPNNLIRYFDETYDSKDRPFDFVLFLDGNIKTGKAKEGNVKDLRNSWKRPKWHILKGK